LFIGGCSSNSPIGTAGTFHKINLFAAFGANVFLWSSQVKTSIFSPHRGHL
jgi:hypothetical protein